MRIMQRNRQKENSITRVSKVETEHQKNRWGYLSEK